ncbi:MAG: TonB family protein [Fusobacterium sp.]|uniref:TonB family protein n=1 Tax=Fusobacterium sp. TaxID=68766 RepID=UPI0026DD7E75|nr:TonB family protein [Fusobacterium sp.]MDO4690340.1 TonB family protein [Fusobacterium sp.]
MEKRDIVAWLLSVIINLLLLFFLTYKPFINVKDIQAIKVGLVSLDTKETTAFKGEENRDAFKKDLEATKVEEKKEDTVTEEVNKTKEKNEQKVIEKNIDEKAEKTVAAVEEVKKEKPSLKDLKKSISDSKPATKNLIQKDKSFNPNDGNFENVDRKVSISENSNGLVSGDISGTSNGDEIFILWSKSNKNPSFPDKAKIQGKTGNMIIKIEVDQAGTILSYSIEKGSGVPEIDLAVEKVIGSWNLKMKKNNKIIAGVFKLDYEFDFK